MELIRLQFDSGLLENRSRLRGLVGVDEVGRGCLAGPVVAGAVWISREFYDRRKESVPEFLRKIKDSKKLTHAHRLEIWKGFEHYRCQHHDILFGWGLGRVKEIEELNILGATMLAMERALVHLKRQIGAVCFENPTVENEGWLTGMREDEANSYCAGLLIDGRPLRKFRWRHHAVPQADDLSLAVGLAAIGAKLLRDQHLRHLCNRWPGYGLSQHKGYGTQRHCQAIREKGLTPVHRVGFCKAYH